MSETLFHVDRRGVATLTLNRPAHFNAMDAEMTRQILAHLGRCETDPAIRLLCLAGSGRHFCAGADLRKLPGLGDAAEQTEEWPSLPELLRRFDALRVPTVALVQGGAIGGGAALVACADTAIAEDTAFLMISEVRLGIPPIALLPYFAAAIGPRQLRRYALNAERIEARRGREIGFVHETCVPGALAATAAPVIEAYLRCGPAAIARAKTAIGAGAAITIEQEAATLAEIEGIAQSAEAVEGIAAFLEKRPPAWFPGA